MNLWLDEVLVSPISLNHCEPISLAEEPSMNDKNANDQFKEGS